MWHACTDVWHGTTTGMHAQLRNRALLDAGTCHVKPHLNAWNPSACMDMHACAHVHARACTRGCM